MIKTVLNSFFNQKTYEDDFFSKKVIAGRYEIYPYYNLKCIYFESELVANTSIKPLSIVIKDKDKNEYYLYLFDDSRKDDQTYIIKILEKFIDFAL
jgi:hypothetical protein